MIEPTKEEMDHLVKVSELTHPDTDVMILDKIKYWYLLTDEQRHKGYCCNNKCCSQKDRFAPRHPYFTFLDADMDDINDNSVVLLRGKGYTPYTLLHDSFEYSKFTKKEKAKGYDNMDFNAMPTSTYIDIINNLDEDECYPTDLDMHTEAEAFFYTDIILSFFALPLEDEGVDDYFEAKRSFESVLNGMANV